MYGQRGRRRKVGRRLATPADVATYYGTTVPQTVQAQVVTLDGEVAGIVGLANEGGGSKAFMDYTEEFEPYWQSITAQRAMLWAMHLVRKNPGRVFAMARHDQGGRMLKRLGFTRVNEEQFLWLG
jgi:hypothetical protein